MLWSMQTAGQLCCRAALELMLASTCMFPQLQCGGGASAISPSVFPVPQLRRIHCWGGDLCLHLRALRMVAKFKHCAPFRRPSWGVLSDAIPVQSLFQSPVQLHHGALPFRSFCQILRPGPYRTVLYRTVLYCSEHSLSRVLTPSPGA